MQTTFYQATPGHFILDAPFQMETIDAVRVPLSPSLYQNDGVLFLQIYFTKNYTHSGVARIF